MMKISRPFKLLTILVCIQFLSLLAHSRETCDDLFKPIVALRFQRFFQKPHLDDPIFHRPHVQKMMSEILRQLKDPNNSNGLSLEPDYGQFGVSMVGGFIIRNGEIQVRIPLLILKERPAIFQRPRYRELSYGERPDQFSPLLPEFAFALLGAIQLYEAENPQLKKLVIFANELKSSTLRTSLARIGFRDSDTNSESMILTQELNQ